MGRMYTTVMTSVMPKGVEHIAEAMEKIEALVVMTSVMPKGVEHSFAQ